CYLSLDQNHDAATHEDIYRFGVSMEGSAKLRAFGFTFASVGVGFSLTAQGTGRVPIIVSAHASISFLFFSVSVSMSFTLGYIELPREVHLAGNQGTSDPLTWKDWNGVDNNGNGVLVLNTADRSRSRNLGDCLEADTTCAGGETYYLEHVDGTASSAKNKAKNA